MRIALIYDAVYPYAMGGAERRYHAVADLTGHAHDVAIYGLHYWRREPDLRLPHCRYVPVAPAVPLYTRGGRRSLVEPFVFAIGLVRALAVSREQVWDVASFPYVSVPVAWLLSRWRGRLLIVTWLEYWGDYWYDYLGMAGAVGKFFERLALRCSPRIIVLSAHTRTQLLRAGVPAHRMTLVPNGVDVGRIAQVPPATTQVDVVYVGRLVKHKRVDLLIRAMPALRARHAGATLLIIGDGPERASLQRLAGEHGVRDAVQFAGRLPSADQVYAHMKASRVLVLPSRREGFGTVVTEAWACGIPAVVCHGADNASVELVNAPHRGRVVAADPDAIASACAALMAVPRHEHSAQLQSDVAQYDWPVIARQLVSTYEAALNDASSAKPWLGRSWLRRSVRSEAEHRDPAA